MVAENFVISDAEVEELTRVIQEKGRVDKGIQDTFCQVWPTAKDGLEVLRKVLEFVPGVGPLAKMAIAIVIAAGDAANNAICT